MLKESWTRILSGLDEALDLCRSLNLADHVERSRFLVYRQHLADLGRALESSGQEGARAAFEAEPLRSMATIAEGAELSDLVPFLKLAPPKAIKDKMVHVLNGPTLPTDEDHNSNQARNILFELNLASKLWKAKLAPELGEHPDLWIEVEGKRLLFQCKRPFSLRSAQRSLGAAKAQLRQDLGHAPAGSRGVIALSLTKLMNPGDKIFVYQAETAARENLSDRLGEISRQVTTGWKGPGANIVGMISHVITPGIDEGGPLWVVVQHTNVEGFAREGSLDQRIFYSVYESLKKIWY